MIMVITDCDHEQCVNTDPVITSNWWVAKGTYPPKNRELPARAGIEVVLSRRVERSDVVGSDRARAEERVRAEVVLCSLLETQAISQHDSWDHKQRRIARVLTPGLEERTSTTR